MARDSFLLRTDPKLLQALKKWAEDELRSTNGQIEYLLRQSLRDAGRLERGEDAQVKGAVDDEKQSVRQDPEQQAIGTDTDEAGSPSTTAGTERIDRPSDAASSPHKSIGEAD
jgi:hypothetical protein